MECPVCFEPYDLERRRPKNLPCGHSVCLQCMQNPGFVNQCPLDSKEFQGQLALLPDNLTVIGLIGQPASSVAQRDALWCRDCDKALAQDCVNAEHRVCPPPNLRAERVAPQVLKIVGLDCASDLALASQRLAAAAPHLEELRMSGPSEEHLRLVCAMASLRVLHVERQVGICADVDALPPRLEELSLRCGEERTLRAVQRLPRLRALEIYIRSSLGRFTFGPLPAGHCGLRKLVVSMTGPIYDVLHEQALLSLLLAHAATLEELQLQCYYDEDLCIPDLAAKLRRCGFKALRRVVLQRPHDYFRATCGAGCRGQLEAVRAALLREDAAGRQTEVAVQCSSCHRGSLITL